MTPENTPESQSKLAPRLRIYSKDSEPEANKTIVEIDGKIASSHASIIAVFDHHRTGARVNLDEVPNIVSDEVLNSDEYVTPMFDTDYLISAIVLRMGGKEKIEPEILKILYSASEWCDYLESSESSEDIKQKGLGLHLYLKNKGFSLMKELCEKKGETTPEGRSVPSDATMTEIANNLGDELENAIKNNTLDKMQDTKYLQKGSAMKERWQEANVRNDELMATVVLKKGEFIDPLFTYELVKGKLMITAIEMTEEAGGKLYQYTIGLKPSSYEELDLRPLIEVMNSADSNVIQQEQAGVPTNEQKRWGGRAAAFGSPFKIHSSLSPDEVERLIEQNISKCSISET